MCIRDSYNLLPILHLPVKLYFLAKILRPSKCRALGYSLVSLMVNPPLLVSVGSRVYHCNFTESPSLHLTSIRPRHSLCYSTEHQSWPSRRLHTYKVLGETVNNVNKMSDGRNKLMKIKNIFKDYANSLFLGHTYIHPRRYSPVRALTSKRNRPHLSLIHI